MKTAIEWLVEEINKLTGLTIQMDEPIIEQAKEMEKEQIIEAYWDGYIKPYSQEMITEAEQYYNENYEQN